MYGKLLITLPLQYVDCAPKDCHIDSATDGPWCLHELMKLLLPDLLWLVLLTEDVTQVGSMSKLWTLPGMLAINNGRWVRTTSAHSVVTVCYHLGYMQQAISVWRETDEGRGGDFTIHPCGAWEAFGGAQED